MTDFKNDIKLAITGQDEGRIQERISQTKAPRKQTKKHKDRGAIDEATPLIRPEEERWNL